MPTVFLDPAKMPHPRFKKRPYSDLPRHRQREAWTRLKNSIRKGVAEGLSPLYESRHIEEENPHPLSMQWADIFLLGADRRTIWNVALVTGRQRLWDDVDELASTAARARLSPEDAAREAEDRFMGPEFWHKVKGPGKKGQVFYEWKPGEDPRHPSLGNKTLSEAEEEEARRIMSSPPAVHAGWTLHRDYRYGIGVHGVVEADQLNRSALEAWVAEFRAQEAQALKGQAWRSETPITRYLLTLSHADTVPAGQRAWLSIQALREDVARL